MLNNITKEQKQALIARILLVTFFIIIVILFFVTRQNNVVTDEEGNPLPSAPTEEEIERAFDEAGTILPEQDLEFESQEENSETEELGFEPAFATDDEGNPLPPPPPDF